MYVVCCHYWNNIRPRKIHIYWTVVAGKFCTAHYIYSLKCTQGTSANVIIITVGIKIDFRNSQHEI